MTDESATDVFDLDSALESAFTSMDEPKENVAEVAAVTELETPEGDKTPEVKDTDQGSETKGEPAEQPLTPPDRWSAERKATFVALPREAQQLLLDREGEVDKAFTQKTQELAEQRKQYEALEQIIAPRRQALAAAYGSEANALQQLFQLSDFANNDPAGFVQWFAQQRGIDLQNAQGAGTDEYVDPVTKQLTQRLSTVEQQLTSQKIAEETARKEAARSEIDTFKAEKDESGNALRPHFDSVKAEMASLMQSGAAKSLTHAYEMAIWANADVRKQILSDQQKAEETKRLEAAKQAAAKAEKARGVTAKSKGAGQSAPSKRGNWEDTLNDTAEELYGAA